MGNLNKKSHYNVELVLRKMPRTLPIKVLQRANPPTGNVAHFVRIGGPLQSYQWLTSSVLVAHFVRTGGPLQSYRWLTSSVLVAHFNRIQWLTSFGILSLSPNHS